MTNLTHPAPTALLSRRMLTFLTIASGLLATSARAGPAFPEFVDPNPSPGNRFGESVLPLITGNVVITSFLADIGGTDTGAVYLFNGATGALISTLTGSTANDQVGFGGVTALANGNYLVLSPNWNNGAATNAGAVTWGNGTTGISGTVSQTNSLVGSAANDQVGGGEGVGVTRLTNGNYLVLSPNWNNGAATNAGAVTWGNGTTGISGAVSTANSLVGSTANDQVGSGVTVLTNGNYIVRSPNWDNGAATDAGAVTWGNRTTGISGAVSEINSLVGSAANDQVGGGAGVGITRLTNGNYVVLSPNWSNGAATNAGAVTWGNGTTGISGAVSTANSLVGSTANDQVGSGVAALTNGNYLVGSPNWDNGTTTDAGAVTWGSGTMGISGAVGTANSLVGSTASDQLGSGVLIPLTNGNYVVSSPNWDNGATTDAGAVTWGNGTIGTSGVVSEANSLVGSSANDNVGNRGVNVGNSGVTALTSGNYVVNSQNWDNGAVTNAGAVTWGNGTTGISGPVTITNSLVGSSAFDQVGRVTALTNGNYVVITHNWDNGASADAGAVTWGNGTIGTSGMVSEANSLVGSRLGDTVGIGDVTALTNGNYVVRSPNWDNGAALSAGAVTWGNGTTGISGPVSATNSLIGSKTNDQVGNLVFSLANGNYVVTSPDWDNGAVTNVGAVTWGNGTTGISGAVSTANSLVGSTANDRVGGGVGGGVRTLTNGNYIVRSPNWDNGAATDAGAVTFGSGTAGVVGIINASNSALGLVANANLRSTVIDNVNNHFIAPFLSEGKVRLGSQMDGFRTTVVGVTPAHGTTSGGTTVTITGTSFSGVTSVTFGGTAATSFVVVNYTTITATTPAGTAGSASVLVTTQGGTNVANTLFTYLPPIIQISGKAQVIPNGDISPSLDDDTDFTGVSLLNIQPKRTFTITNLGTAPLNLTGSPFVQITGPTATDFAVTLQPASMVAPGNSTTFEITFDPRLPGPRSATVTIASDASNASSFSFAITGEGILPVREPQTITFTPPPTLYPAQSPFALSATASSGLPVTLAVVSGPATVTGNSLALTGPGTVKITATQAGNTEYLPAKTVTTTLIVRADPTTLTLLNLAQTYDGNPKPISTIGAASPTITYKIAGVESPTAPTNAGSYPVKAVAGSVTKSGTLVIAKAVLTITPDNLRRFLGFANPTLTYTVSGYRGTDTVAIITRAPTLSTTAKVISPLGVYPIRAAGATALNYTFNYQLGSLVVDGFAGNYEALLVDTNNLPVGKLTLTVPATGTSFTGKLFTATETAALSLKSSLTTDPQTESATGSVTVTKNTIPYEVSFTLPPNGNVTASAKRATVPLGNATNGRKLLTLPRGAVVNYAGAHTAVLEPSTQIGNTTLSGPTGAGWATATISTTGVMILTGRFGDGTPFTTTLPPDSDPNPTYRLFIQPYKAPRTESYLAGAFTLAPHPSLPNRRYIEQIDLTWKKTSLPTDASYRTSFGPVNTVMMLDPWLPPVAAKGVVPAITLAERLGLTGSPISFGVTHSETGSAAQLNLPTRLALSPKNTISVTDPSANTTKWKTLTFNATTGTFTGSFELLDNPTKRPVTFSGVLRQPATTPDPLIGNGHYLLPPLSGTERTTGEIRFTRP